MRILDYSRFVLDKKAKFFPLKAKLGYRRMPRRRPRSIRERNDLMKMDKKRFEDRIRRGEIEILNPRSIKVNL